MATFRDIQTDSLRLPDHERAMLASVLLESLPLHGFAEEALLDAARDRYNEVALARIEPLSWEQFHEQLQTIRLT